MGRWNKEQQRRRHGDGGGAAVIDMPQQRHAHRSQQAHAPARGGSRHQGGNGYQRAGGNGYDPFADTAPPPAAAPDAVAPTAATVAPETKARAPIPPGFKVLGVLALAALAYFAVYNVEGGYRGVVTTFGKVEPQVLKEGLQFVVPLAQRVHMGSVATEKAETTVSVLTKDRDAVQVKLVVNYHADPLQLPNLYRETHFGDIESKIVLPALQEAPETVFGQRPTDDLVLKRREVNDAIKAGIADRLQRHWLKLDEFTVNYELPEATVKAVEARAAQAAVAARAAAEAAEKDRAQAEAQKALDAAHGAKGAITGTGKPPLPAAKPAAPPVPAVPTLSAPKKVG